MKELGYTLVWRTKCFIDGGCGAECMAYTSGSGDFVLFDSLGDPWPVHSCYQNRHGKPGTTGFSPHSVRGSHVPGDPKRSWNPTHIVEIPPTKGGPKIGITADVFELRKGAVTQAPQFKALPSAAREALLKKLDGRTALAVLDSGDGRRFVALLNPQGIRRGDSVVVDLKPTELPTGLMFRVTSVVMVWRDGTLVDHINS